MGYCKDYGIKLFIWHFVVRHHAILLEHVVKTHESKIVMFGVYGQTLLFRHTKINYTLIYRHIAF